MKPPHFSYAVAGICLCACSGMLSQPAGEQHKCPENPAPDSVAPAAVSTHTPARQNFWQTLQLTGGQLTIPFKIRPKKENGTFRLTTDVTLGFYIGATKRLKEGKEHYLTIPLTAGLTFINVDNDNTSLDRSDGGADVVPGITWSSGIIMRLEQYNFGLIFGKDYASEVGNQWMYHRKWWWSFGLGFSFLN